MCNCNSLMLILLSCCLLLSIASCASTARRIESRETTTCEGRQTPGLICESCELLSTCVKHSTGWANIPVETCDTENGFYCNARLGMCSNMTGPCHPFAVDGNFPCTSHGIFPDPYDCQKYHMCYFIDKTLVSASVDCGSDKAFDAATGQCSLSLDDRVCQQKQFKCINAGEAHPWPNNANIFYICKALTNQQERVLYPTLYRCADGEIFDGYYCRSGVMTPMTPTPTPTIDSQFTTSSATTTALDGCKEQGLQADVNDCHSYFYCSAINGTIRHLKCPAFTYYNVQFSSCTLGDCAN